MRLAAVALLLLPLLAVAEPAAAAPAAPPAQDVRELTRTSLTLEGRPIPAARSGFARRARIAPGPTPALGTRRQWLGLDDVKGSLYRKDYTLRGVGEHIEVWVADDLAFPADDCRPARSTRITTEQVGALVQEFDRTIYPRETAAFSTPPERDGTDPLLDGNDYTGGGEKTVTLVDNVRDDNFYDFPATPTYLAGFFSAQLSALVDRNVMTIDAYDWLHRSGATPPAEPTGDLCTSRPARPRLYEGTFAHEWQHLLQSYADPDEEPWVNEGLSDYAQTLVGYVDGTATVYHPGADVHLACFQGFGIVRTGFNVNPRDCGGPQNSLTLWDEGTPGEVLADYGHAYQFMLYLRDRFGAAALSRLHRDGARQGLAGVSAALGDDVRLYGVLHDFQTMNLVDKLLGDPGGTMVGVPRDRVTAPSVRATVNLANPAAYDYPGAAPNGADYVRLRDAAGRWLRGRDLRAVSFTGARTLAPPPLAWTVRDGALFSGNTSGIDAAAIVAVSVPTADPTLRLRARYGAEDGYDYGYVVVSTDNGRSYEAVGGDQTDAGPLGPGVTGQTGGFVAHRYDLSGYAGQKILLGFRYVSDGDGNAGGWLIDDVRVGDDEISDGTTLAGFRSPAQITPIPVHRFDVKLVGLDEPGRRARQVPVSQFAALRDYDKVVAIVAYDEPTERYAQYAQYVLEVNGVTQPGGSRP